MRHGRGDVERERETWWWAHGERSSHELRVLWCLVLDFCINSTRRRGGLESPHWIRALRERDVRAYFLYGAYFFVLIRHGEEGATGITHPVWIAIRDP
jgi:hypothetical protein